MSHFFKKIMNYLKCVVLMLVLTICLTLIKPGCSAQIARVNLDTSKNRAETHYEQPLINTQNSGTVHPLIGLFEGACLLLGIAGVALGLYALPSSGITPELALGTIVKVGDYDHVGDEWNLKFDVTFKFGQNHGFNALAVKVFIDNNEVYSYGKYWLRDGAGGTIAFDLRMESIDDRTSQIKVEATLDAWKNNKLFGWSLLDAHYPDERFWIPKNHVEDITVNKPYDYDTQGPLPLANTHGGWFQATSEVKGLSQKLLYQYHAIDDQIHEFALLKTDLPDRIIRNKCHEGPNHKDRVTLSFTFKAFFKIILKTAPPWTERRGPSTRDVTCIGTQPCNGSVKSTEKVTGNETRYVISTDGIYSPLASSEMAPVMFNFTVLDQHLPQAPMSYNISFGDGVNATDPITNHSYLDDSVYRIDVFAESEDYRYHFNFNLSIINVAPSIQNLTVPQNATIGDSHIFEVEVYDPSPVDMSMMNVTWCIGDNQYSGRNISHVFHELGFVTYIVNVTDGQDVTEEIGVVLVRGFPPVIESVYVGNPHCPSTNLHEGSFTLLNVSITPGNATIAQVLWEIGDGGYTYGQCTNYTYRVAGTYNTTLIVKDTAGLSDVYIVEVDVQPVSPWYPMVKAGAFNGTISAEAFAFHPNPYVSLMYQWDVNGTLMTGRSINFTAGTPGNYELNLAVSDGRGNSVLTSAVVHVGNDVAVAQIELSKFIVGEGFCTTMNTTIINLGIYTEIFNVTMLVDTTPIGEQQITLNLGENRTLMFLWNTTDFTKGNYTISVMADIVPGEIDANNNMMTDGTCLLSIPGDIDGDRDIDIFDIVTIANAYGSHEGDANYTAVYDIDDDRDIDIFDIVAACSHYGESW